MTAHLNLLVYLALFLSGVHAACADYSSESSCSDVASCVWSVVTSGQCVVKSSVDCPVDLCRDGAPAGCIYTSATPGQCRTPNCGSKLQSACTTAAACDWADAANVCALPDTVRCVDDGEVCRTDPYEGKSSCEYESMQSVCVRQYSSYCSSDSIMCSKPGCIRDENQCILDPELTCETFDIFDGYPCNDESNSPQPGCTNSLLGVNCSEKQCNTIGVGAQRRCDTASTGIGCTLIPMSAACTLKPGVICSETSDGSCSALSLCDSVASIPESCEPDTSVQCSAASTGGSCDEASDSAGCKWVPGTGTCVEEEGEGEGKPGKSIVVMSPSSVLMGVALICALFLLN